MDSANEFTSFHDQVTSKLVQTTRAVGRLSSEDLKFHRSSNRDVAESLDEQSARLLSLTSSLLKVVTVGTDVKAPVLHNEESIEDNWRGLVDVIDNMLEKTDACLDEFTGIIKKLSPSQEEQGQASRQKAASKFPSVYESDASTLPKPQLKFHHPPNNLDSSPFRPLLKTKPHAIVPLEESLQIIDANSESPFYRNPYEEEIQNAKYPLSTYSISPPISYQPFESTTATFVNTIEGVNAMLSELKSAKEIAVDLEHHDAHSYRGLVSLMQISTREKDWVIDTLNPWREELQQLNEVFADPNILKVFHGSSMDIIWLQRDLGLYVVGMFDTYHAAIALNYPKRSLKVLLEQFVELNVDKSYQMADWRIRPLTTGMFDYARSDTHYLLYIYDHLRNLLVEKSTAEEHLVDYVLEQSRTEALQRYEHTAYDAATGQGPGGWYDFLTRNAVPLSKKQFAVLKAVHQWRDQVAREEDEGVQSILPKYILLRVAQTMPPNRAALFRTLSPVRPIVRSRISHLLEVIKAAKVAGEDGPEWRDVAVPARGPQTLATADTARVEKGLLTPPEKKDAGQPTASRSDVSQFWGAVLRQHEATVPSPYSAVASVEALRLSLPLPPMPMTVAKAREKLGSNAAINTVPLAEPVAPVVPTKDSQTNEVFVVKDIAGRRKRNIDNVNERGSSSSATNRSSSSDAIPEVDIIEQSAQTSHRNPPTKYVPTQPSQMQRTRNLAQEVTPFDYSTAASVLHAETAPRAGGSPSNSSKFPFNPYTKALNAPPGMPKTRKDSGGKTFTFRQ